MGSICNIRAHANLFDLPMGGISDPPILVNLLQAINLTGPLFPFKVRCIEDPARNWVPYYPIVAFPKQYKSFQSAMLGAMSVDCALVISRRIYMRN